MSEFKQQPQEHAEAMVQEERPRQEAVPQDHGGSLLSFLPDPHRADKKAAFLQVFLECGNADEARRIVGLGAGTPWDWRKADPEFDAAWRDVERCLVANVGGTLYQRAVNGTGMPAVVAGFGFNRAHDPEHWSEKHMVIGGGQADRLTEALNRVADIRERLEAQELAARGPAPLDLPAGPVLDLAVTPD